MRAKTTGEREAEGEGVKGREGRRGEGAKE